MKRKPASDGMRKTPTGNSWSAMMSRCFNENYNGYKGYGSKGITVCEFIRIGPSSLIALIGERPEGLSIDRADNDGNYSCGACNQCLANGWPMNIRWLDRIGQGRNRSTCVFVERNGIRQCVTELAEASTIRRQTIFGRLKRGWKTESLLESVPKPTTHTVGGMSKTIREWSAYTGIKVKTLQRRLAFGLSGDDLIKPLNEAYRRTNYRQERAAI